MHDRGCPKLPGYPGNSDLGSPQTLCLLLGPVRVGWWVGRQRRDYRRIEKKWWRYQRRTREPRGMYGTTSPLKLWGLGANVWGQVGANVWGLGAAECEVGRGPKTSCTL